METLRSWVLRICHVIRTVAFTNQPRLSFANLGAISIIGLALASDAVPRSDGGQAGLGEEEDMQP